MTMLQYVNNAEGLNADQKFPRSFLEAIYVGVREGAFMLRQG
jgi:Sec7-like guanine-nucleotide exchange factor